MEVELEAELEAELEVELEAGGRPLRRRPSGLLHMPAFPDPTRGLPLRVDGLV